MTTSKQLKTQPDETLKDNIRHVVDVYHESFKKDSQTILKEFENASLKSNCAYLYKAKDLFNYLYQKLIFHLVMEENVVFPMLLGTANKDRIETVLETMAKEHEEDNAILKEVISTLEQSNEDIGAPLINSLQRFKEQYKEHTHYEEEYVLKNAVWKK